MRNPTNRFPVKRLFVLGAGASYAATVGRKPSRSEAPLDRDFVRRLGELNVKRPKWVCDARDRVVEQWKDNTPMEKFGLEEAILRQLGHIEFLEAIHPRRTRNAITEFEWLSLVTHLICHVMRHTKEAKRGVYERFIENVFPSGVGAEEYEDRIVTFNYDDLSDRHVVRRVGIERTYFDRIRQVRGDESHRVNRCPNPLVVKLHGSVSWRCEKTEFERILNGQFEESRHFIPDVWHSQKGTPSPDDEVFPLVVPPLPTKPLSSVSLFQYLWTRAYEYLHQARELVICGYSLPPADTLAWSLFGNFRNPRLQEVTIVDPEPAIIAKWQSLLRRRGVAAGARWTYYDDFADYVERMRDEAGQ